MADRDRIDIILGLENIVKDPWMWNNADYYACMCKDALALLKEPVKPKVGHNIGHTWGCA